MLLECELSRRLFPFFVAFFFKIKVLRRGFVSFYYKLKFPVVGTDEEILIIFL